MKKLKLVVFFIALLVGCGQSCASTFIWSNWSASKIKYTNGVDLAGSTNPAVGCFVQLIDAGADRVNNTAVYSGSGVSGDDQVVQTAWIGKDARKTPDVGVVDGANGVVYSVFSNAVPGRSYFVRAWSQASPDYGRGIVPVQNSLFNDSASWVHKTDGETFEFASPIGWATSKTALPAPGTSVVVTVKSGASAQLSWTAAGGATGYWIYRTTSVDTAPSATDKIGTTSSLSYTDSPSGVGTFYYWVEPVNAAGSGGLSVSTVFRKAVAMPWLNLLLE